MPTEPVEVLVARQPWASLVPHLEAAGCDVSATTQALKRYATALLQWNRSVSNLISRYDEERFVERHVLESVAPAGQLRATGGKRWVDFGSGGGLPAIPLAICGVGQSWTLVESRRTKTLFLRKAISELGLSGVEVVLGRLESMPLENQHLAAFDGVTSRATLRIAPTLAAASKLIVPGGAAFLWKGSRREDELADPSAWEGAWALDGEIPIPGSATVVVRLNRK